MPAGRPSSFKPEYVEQARKLASLGAIDIEIADFFNVSERTLNSWKHQHPEFLQSIKEAKDEADNRVEQSLYKRAIGFEHEAVKIFFPKGAESPVYAPYREYVPPDPTSMIFWLKNRRRNEWRDKQETELSGNVGVVLMHSVPQPERD